MSASLQFADMLIAEEGDYALGVERNSGRKYISVAGDEGDRHFEISDEEFERLLDDPAAGRVLADRCRAGEEDGRLFDGAG